MIIDKAKAIELLERAVAEKGADHVDPNSATCECAYVNVNLSPGCIVGHAYLYAGATVSQLLAMNGFGDIYGVAKNGELPLGTTADALDIFAEAQCRKDNGDTWGATLAAAKKSAA